MFGGVGAKLQHGGVKPPRQTRRSTRLCAVNMDSEPLRAPLVAVTQGYFAHALPSLATWRDSELSHASSTKQGHRFAMSLYCW